MLNKHIRKIEPIIEELKGERIEKVDGVLIPEYLYSFPNGLWLSFDLDKRDNYFDVKLGRLFSLDDVMPRLIVLESIEYYFAAVNELKLGHIKYEFSHISYEIENVFEILKNYLKVIVVHYNQLKEVGKTKVLISKEEERLKSYLLADLSYSSNLELDLKERIESFTSRVNKIDSNKMIKRANKRKQLKWQLFDGIGELIFGLGIIGIGLLCAWLFSLKKDISDIPFEVFIILALVIVIIIAFIVGLIVLLIKKKKK